MIIQYETNNSGGYWWLKDSQWIALEKAGWNVLWGGRLDERKTLEQARASRYMGALAVSATKEFPSMRDAILEFEKVTGHCASDEGCNCCGPPHNFEIADSDDYSLISGSEIIDVLEIEDKDEIIERLKR